MHSDSTVEADTTTDLMPGILRQHNLTLELFPNHSENLESAKKVKFCLCGYISRTGKMNHNEELFLFIFDFYLIWLVENIFLFS